MTTPNKLIGITNCGDIAATLYALDVDGNVWLGEVKGTDLVGRPKPGASTITWTPLPSTFEDPH